MITLLDGTQGNILIEVEYFLFFGSDKAKLPKELTKTFSMNGHPCWWVARTTAHKCYCRQLIVVPYPFSEYVIDKIVELWDHFVVDRTFIDRVEVVQTRAVTRLLPKPILRL